MKVFAGTVVLLLFLTFVSIFIGPATPVDVWVEFLNSAQTLHSVVQSRLSIFELRLVHVLLSAAVGCSLATAGRCMQQFLQNPLADPHVVGLSAGSTAAVLITILFAPTFAQSVFAGGVPALWLSAFLGAFLSYVLLRALLFGFAKHWGASGLVLLGVFLNAGISALLMVIFARLSPTGLSQVQSWTLGSIQPYSLSQAVLLAPFILLPAVYLMGQERQLLLLSFGSDFASTHGVDVERLRTQILFCVMLISSACVCAAGSIGFVGLLVPHLTRRWLVQCQAAWMRPVFNGLCGAIVLLSADLLSRTLTSPTELPVGVYTALLSVPFLLLVLRRGRQTA